MKGYQINEKLYIFPQVPAQISGITEDITVIYVRSKDLEAWKTANTSYKDLFKPYNYETITVLPKPWAGHTDDDFPVEPPVVINDITYSGFTEYVSGPATGAVGSTITITAVNEEEFPDIELVSDDAEITKNLSNWTFTMPETDVAISVEYNEPVQKNIFKVGFISPLTDSDWELTWNNTTNDYADQDPDTGIYSCSNGDEISLVMHEGYTFDLESETEDKKLILSGVYYVPQQDEPRAAVFTVSEDLDLTVEVFNPEPEPYSPQLGDTLYWVDSESSSLYGDSSVIDTGSMSGYIGMKVGTSSNQMYAPDGNEYYFSVQDTGNVDTEEAIQIYISDGPGSFTPISGRKQYITTPNQ